MWKVYLMTVLQVLFFAHCFSNPGFQYTSMLGGAACGLALFFAREAGRAEA